MIVRASLIVLLLVPATVGAQAQSISELVQARSSSLDKLVIEYEWDSLNQPIFADPLDVDSRVDRIELSRPVRLTIVRPDFRYESLVNAPEWQAFPATIALIDNQYTCRQEQDGHTYITRADGMKHGSLKFDAALQAFDLCLRNLSDGLTIAELISEGIVTQSAIEGDHVTYSGAFMDDGVPIEIEFTLDERATPVYSQLIYNYPDSEPGTFTTHVLATTEVNGFRLPTHIVFCACFPSLADEQGLWDVRVTSVTREPGLSSADLQVDTPNTDVTTIDQRGGNDATPVITRVDPHGQQFVLNRATGEFDAVPAPGTPGDPPLVYRRSLAAVGGVALVAVSLIGLLRLKR